MEWAECAPVRAHDPRDDTGKKVSGAWVHSLGDGGAFNLQPLSRKRRLSSYGRDQPESEGGESDERAGSEPLAPISREGGRRNCVRFHPCLCKCVDARSCCARCALLLLGE